MSEIDDLNLAMAKFAKMNAVAAAMCPVTTGLIESIAAKPWWATTEWWRCKVLGRAALQGD